MLFGPEMEENFMYFLNLKSLFSNIYYDIPK